MRNLSKVLALVLSLAFVLSCMTGAIGLVTENDNGEAKFSDADTFTAAGKEAIAILNALEIVNGNTDGTFAPTRNVTRQEFIKMASIAAEGADVATTYGTTTIGSYTDVAGLWGIAYMNYGYLQGIMVGYGDNTMRPNNDVTGYEAVKMMLVILGYNAEIEGLVGTNWKNNTVTLARKVGLLKNLDTYSLEGAFNREASAILVKNALYTNTVDYSTLYAQATDETLGEKVFDLLDIYGVVVENKYGDLGLNWTNAIGNDLSVANVTIASTVYVDYRTQIKDTQTVFAFRDFSTASTLGGFYVPRIVVADIASDYADLGRAYRVLTTRAQNVTYTNEVRKVYGVLWEVDAAADYNYTSGILSGSDKVDGTNTLKATSTVNTAKDIYIKYNVINAMFLSAKKANSSVTLDSKVGDIFIDGALASYNDAATLIKDYKDSSAPFRAIDNDNDGIVDSLFLYKYTAAKVLAVDGQDLTLAGLDKKTIQGDVSAIAVGDYVAYYADNQYKYVDKLTVFTGTVSNYSNNSGTENVENSGIGVTKGNGTYTINGNKYTFGSLATNLGDDERQYFEQLMGTGSASVADVTLQYVMDGSFIVAAFLTSETHWENYAIVIGYNQNDVSLGMRHIRLYTEDNEYKDFYIASVDGNQIYNNVVSGTIGYPKANTLVRYEEIGTNMIALYTANYANASDKYSKDKVFYYTQNTDTWVGYDYSTTGVQNSTMYNWGNGVVFVSYSELLKFADTSFGVAYADLEGNWAYQWRAYYKGEFQTSDTTEASFGQPKGARLGDEVVYADSLNNVMTLKAAKISFNYVYRDFNYVYRYYNLPGLVLRSGQAIWGTVKGLTSFGTTVDIEDATTKYVYKVSILLPWSAGTKEITVYTDVRNATFTVGDVYKMYTDEDGICRRWEVAATETIKESGGVLITGTDYLENAQYIVTGIIANADGGYTLEVKYPTVVDNNIFWTNVDYLTMTADTDAYFTEDLFTTDFAAVNYLTYYGYLGVLSMGNHPAFYVYADINPSTKEVYSIWFNGETKVSTAVRSLNVTLISYDLSSQKAVYGIKGINFVKTADNETVSTTEYMNYYAGERITVVQKPYELLMPVGDTTTCDVTCTATEDGGWVVKGIAAVDSPYTWVKYDKTNAQTTIWDETAGKKLSIYTKSTGGVPVAEYDILAASTDSNATQIAWYRSEFGRIDPIGGANPTGFYKTAWNAAITIGVAANNELSNYYLGYNPDGNSNVQTDAYNYEEFYVLVRDDYAVTINYVRTTLDDAMMIVLVDTDATSADVAVYPYNSTDAAHIVDGVPSLT